MLNDVGRLLVSCTDRSGIVAALSQFLATRGANILHSDHHTRDPEGGRVFMRTEFFLDGLDANVDGLSEAFAAEVAVPLNMQWRLHLASHRKRVCILVSRYDHCLAELLWRWRRGELYADIPLVVVGGLPRDRQRFNATAANVTSLMLLAVVALIMPAMFELVQGTGLPHPRAEAVNYDSDVERLSVGVALVLLSTYVAGLRFSMRTHRDLFNPEHEEGDHVGEPWTVRTSVIMLAIAGAAVGVMSEILVGSITEASEAIGLSPFFVGVIVVAIVGNAAEHWVGIYFASRDKMDLSVNIAIGSAAQIALFAAPVLMLISLFVGDFPMAFVFNGFEIGAVVLAVLIAQQVTHEGESTWFEGFRLLAVYAVLGLTSYFV